jgi:O-antigen ligase
MMSSQLSKESNGVARRLEKVGVVAQEAAKADWLFRVFAVWTLVLLCRIHDLFPFLADLRPGMLGVGLSLGLFVFNFSSLGQAKYLTEKQIKRYFALVAVMVVSIIFSLYPRLSFMFIFTIYINTFVFVLIFYKVINSVHRLKRLILLCCLGNGLYNAIAVLKGSIVDGRLAFGDMFDPNDLAFFALSFLPLNLIYISKDNPPWVRLSCLCSMGAGALMIFLTGSRGGILAFCVALLLLLLLKTRTITAKMKLFVLGLCMVMLIIAPINTVRYMTIFSIGSDYNVSDETGRMQIWKIGLSWLWVNPLTGVGVGCFNEAVGREREARGSITLQWQSPHNSVVQIATETGVIGLLLYLGMSVGIWRSFWRGARVAESETLKRICEMGLLGFAGLFVSGLLLSQAYSAIWSFYLVLSAVLNQMLPIAKIVPYDAAKNDK